MFVAILGGLVVAALAPALQRGMPRHAGWLLALWPLALTVWFATLFPAVEGGTAYESITPWTGSLGVGLVFRIDALSLLFELLIAGIGTFILVYAGAYMGDAPATGRLFSLLILFMTSMVGLVAADNLLLLFIFWEGTSVASYLLIGLKHEEEKARKSALAALLVTGTGGLALLAGLLLLGGFDLGTRLSDLPLRAAEIKDGPFYAAIVVLVLLGAFTKSAQWPFSFWLPAAMVAPTPVSAYLHSATMVKAGIYLLARLNPVLGDTALWYDTLAIVGGITMLFGAVLAGQQTDLKLILAWTTVSGLGTLTFLLGIGSPAAVTAAMKFLPTHALYKAALFMVAGSVDHETGTRDIRQLHGLRRVMPITSLAALLAAFSQAGLPPFMGFVSKEITYKATLDSPLLTAVAVLANAFMVAVAAVIVFEVFLGRKVIAPRPPHDGPLGLWLGALVLAVLGIAISVLVGFGGPTLVEPAAYLAMFHPEHVAVKLWAGLTGKAGAAFALSLVTLALGWIFYRQQARLVALHERAERFLWRIPQRLYERALDGMQRGAAGLTRLVQGGLLRAYLATIVLTVLALAGSTLLRRADLALPAGDVPPRFHELLLAGAMTVAAVVIALARSRLLAVVALGVIGYGVALFFLFLGAPDLAMTQFAIETLSVVLFVLVLWRLPPFLSLSRPRAKFRDAVIAAIGGSLVAGLVLTTVSLSSPSRLASYFAETSYPLARGRNVVNVILVDFRGLDTLGEITVLSVAALGVYALLRVRPDGGDR